MAKKKKVKTYRVKWSMGCCDHGGTIEVDAEDVEGMTDGRRTEYFQECVDDEVATNGPAGFVDSVDEVEE